MRTRIIAVLNQKGGVGKTTTCVNLGAALARRGKRVLLIDLDPQANLTVHLGADFRQVRKSTYSLLLGEHPLGQAVTATSDPNLRYVPATLALANAEIQLASAVGRELLLREAIEVWLEDELHTPAAGAASPPRVDYVFIDCPPSLGILTMNALCAANEVLLPIQCEFFALQGVAGILESLKAVQRLNRGLELSMVVPCMVDKRKTLARDVIEEVEKYFGSLVTKTRIRNNVKLAEAPSHGLTIFEYDASSNGARDYEDLAREVLGENLDDPIPSNDEPVPEPQAAPPVVEQPQAVTQPPVVEQPPAQPAATAPPAAEIEPPASVEPVPCETVPVADAPCETVPVESAPCERLPVADVLVVQEPPPETAEMPPMDETSEAAPPVEILYPALPAEAVAADAPVTAAPPAAEPSPAESGQGAWRADPVLADTQG